MAAWLEHVLICIRDAAYDNIVWIRRCKKDFDMQIDPLVAKEAGRGSVWAFYSLILRKFGPFLGPLKQTSGPSEADGHSNHHGAMFQLVHDGGLGLICYDWVPPRVSKGVQQPMSLLHYGSVTLERVDGAIESTSYFKVTHSNPRISIGQCDGSLQVENTYFRDFDFKGVYLKCANCANRANPAQIHLSFRNTCANLCHGCRQTSGTIHANFQKKILFR